MEEQPCPKRLMQAGRPFMVIRAMSDTANHTAANVSFDEFIVEAGERSAQTLIFLEEVV